MPCEVVTLEIPNFLVSVFGISSLPFLAMGVGGFSQHGLCDKWLIDRQGRRGIENIGNVTVNADCISSCVGLNLLSSE